MAGDETGIGDGGKRGGYSDKVGGQETASRAMVRATVTRWRGPPRRHVQRPGQRGTTTAIIAGAASDVGSERKMRGQDKGAARGNATTRWRNETIRGQCSERTTRGRECSVMRRRDGGATRGDTTTSLRD